MKEIKKNFITTFIIGALLLAGIVVTVNMIFDNINVGRFDLTADQVYNISPSVKNIFEKLDAPIEITYYVSSSEKMPSRWKNLERDVIDKLQELELASAGNLSYTVFDPSAEEEKEAYEEAKQQEEGEEDILQRTTPKITRKKIAEQLYEKGVIPFGVQSAERDEFAVKRVYSSLVLSYLDRKEDVIQEVRPETFGNLEYEVMSRIFKLISNKRPKLGFYPSQPEVPPQYRQYYQQAPPDQYELAARLLRESGYDVTRTNIKADDPIPENIQTMVVMAEQPMNERQMYEIDKLVNKGVRVIIAGQAFNYQISPSGQPGQFMLMGRATGMNISALTRNYGFEFDNKMFMDKNTAYIQVPVYQTQSFGGMQLRQQRFQPVTKPVIIKVDQENINTGLSISNKITEIFYMYGGRLLVFDEILKENDLKSTELFTSSDEGWTRQIGYGGPVDETKPADNALLRYQPLGVLLEGNFKPKYVDQNIPTWPTTPGEDQGEEIEQPSEIINEAKENKMIVIGCSTIFKSDVLQAVVSHRALLLNCVDALTLGDELINIRSKNIIARRIKNTSSVGKAVSKAFVVWFSPLIFVAVGIYLTMRRRMKS